MNNNFKKFINTAKDIKLSEEKKGIIRGRIIDFVELNPLKTPHPQPLKSPLYVSKFSVLNFSKAISFALIILIAGGSTISYASEDTLPGDLFYTVKVNFTEPIQSSLAFTPEAKLEIKTKQVERRLTEAQILLQKNDTTPAKHAEVEARVERKVSEISETMTKLQERGDVEVILKTTSQLEPVLQAHRQALQEVIEKETQTSPQSLNSQENTDIEPVVTPEQLNEDITIQEQNNLTESTEIEIEKSKTEIADTLLRRVEQSLAKVEQQEVDTLVKIEELTQNGSDTASQVATNKVLELSKEIETIRQTHQKVSENQNTNLDVIMDTNTDIETYLDMSITEINESLRQDIQDITVIEAELLLEESKKLFEQGFYKESLLRAQEALKLTGNFEISQKLSELTQRTVSTENDINTTQDTTLEPEIETILEIENQAIEAIESLEEQLNIQ